ncbi:membrane protein [Halopelagius inordinatus]|uniref:Membrane protein n=1 Tax=Halopelagius inordinatus TaxID=553467 RepID=A0A1I2LBU8_9EURY|nr:YihY/virulence factor BrkB family protein [Halopelagius inordinatus]SFF76725.1 membrane protein [Halopelagius inordinatus]
MSYIDGRLGVVLAVARAAQEHDVEYPAASLAYYGFVSLFPLLVLVLALVSRPVAASVRDVTPPFLTPEARQLVSDAMTATEGQIGATVLAVLVLGWSGANVAVGFLTVVERVEGDSGWSIRHQLCGGVAVLASLLLALFSIVTTSAAFSFLPDTLLVAPVALAALFVVLTVAFVPLYYVPSRTVTDLRAAVPGALTAAIGWTALLVVIHLYAINAGRYAVYGVISGIIIILTSLYLAAFVLLLGVVVNATLVGGIDPDRSI